MQFDIETTKFIKDNILDESIKDGSLNTMITYMKIPVISADVVTRIDNRGVALLISFIKDYITVYRNYSMALRDKTSVSSNDDIKFVYTLKDVTFKGVNVRYTFCYIYIMAQILFGRYFDKENPKYKGYDTEKMDLSYLFDFMNFIKELDSKLVSYYKRQVLTKYKDILSNASTLKMPIDNVFSSLSGLFSDFAVELLSIKERPFEIDDAVIFNECNNFLKKFLKDIYDEDFEKLYELLCSLSTLLYEHISIVNIYLKENIK